MPQTLEDIFEQITGLTDVHFECSRRDKRQASRIAFSFCINIIPVKDGRLTSPIRVRTRDLSTTGIGLLCAHKMLPGESFLIHLPRKRGGQIGIVCRVTRCKPATDQFHIIGATFVGFQRHPAPTPSASPLSSPV